MASPDNNTNLTQALSGQRRIRAQTVIGGAPTIDIGSEVSTLLHRWEHTSTQTITEQQRKFCEERNLGPLLRLEKWSHVKVQSQSREIIENLKLLPDINELYIDGVKGFRPLVELSKFPEDEVQNLSILALAALASHPACRLRIMQEVGWHNIRQKWSDSHSTVMKKALLSLLANLSGEKENQEGIVNKGVPIIMELFSQKIPKELLSETLKAFSIITMIKNHGAREVWETQLLPIILPYALNDHEPTLQTPALNIIANICNGASIEVVDQISKSGILEVLVPLLANENPEVLKITTLAVAYIIKSDYGRKEFSALGGVRSIVSLLDNTDRGIQFGTTTAVDNLADFRETNLELQKYRGVEPLKELIFSTPFIEVEDNARRALGKLSIIELDQVDRRLNLVDKKRIALNAYETKEERELREKEDKRRREQWEKYRAEELQKEKAVLNKKAQEESARRAAEEDKRRAEDEKTRREEEERQRKEAEEARKRAEQIEREKQMIDAERKRIEEERLKMQKEKEERERRERLEEEERQRRIEENKKLLEAERKRFEEERGNLERERRIREEEELRLKEEEGRIRLAEQERIKREEEERSRIESERKKIELERMNIEVEKRKFEEEEERKKIERIERERQEEERKKVIDAEKERIEQERKRIVLERAALEEARLKEDWLRRQREEEESKRMEKEKEQQARELEEERRKIEEEKRQLEREKEMVEKKKKMTEVEEAKRLKEAEELRSKLQREEGERRQKEEAERARIEREKEEIEREKQRLREEEEVIRAREEMERNARKELVYLKREDNSRRPTRSDGSPSNKRDEYARSRREENARSEDPHLKREEEELRREVERMRRQEEEREEQSRRKREEEERIRLDGDKRERHKREEGERERNEYNRGKRYEDERGEFARSRREDDSDRDRRSKDKEDRVRRKREEEERRRLEREKNEMGRMLDELRGRNEDLENELEVEKSRKKQITSNEIAVGDSYEEEDETSDHSTSYDSEEDSVPRRSESEGSILNEDFEDIGRADPGPPLNDLGVLLDGGEGPRPTDEQMNTLRRIGKDRMGLDLSSVLEYDGRELIPVLIWILKNYPPRPVNERIVTLSLLILAILAYNREANQTTIRREGGAEEFRKLVDVNVPSVKARATLAFAAYMLNNEFNKRESAKELIPRIMGVLRQSASLDETLKMSTCACLASMVDDNTDNQDKFRKESGVKLVMSLVSANQIPPKYSINVIAALAHHNKENQDLMRKEYPGIFRKVVRLLSVHTKPQIRKAAAHALVELARKNKKNQKEVHRAGAVPYLLALLGSFYAGGALGDPRLSGSMASINAGPVFLVLGEDEVANCLYLIWAISKHLKGNLLNKEFSNPNGSLKEIITPMSRSDNTEIRRFANAMLEMISTGKPK